MNNNIFERFSDVTRHFLYFVARQKPSNPFEAGFSSSDEEAFDQKDPDEDDLFYDAATT